MEAPLIHASAGAFVAVPRGVVHTYKSVGATAGRMVVVATPAGLEQFFAEVGQPASGATPPAGPPDIARMAAIARRYELEVVGPPPR